MTAAAVIGREREIADGHGFLADIAERPRGLLLAGEPGMGKTTVWSTVLDDAGRRGYGVLVARPSEAEADLAFSVLTDLFASVEGFVLGELPGIQRAALEQALRRAETGSAVDPVAVALAVLGMLRQLSRDAPLVVAVDDLQWVDAPSLRSLTYAIRRLESERVGLVATVRAGVDLELTRLAERDGNSVDRIEIAGLGKRQLARIVFERTGQALSPPQLQRLTHLSGGSPFYALEIAATGDLEHVPPSLAGALRARLERLSPEARTTGLTAAVLGRIDADIVPVRDTALNELRAARVVDERAGSLWFAHPLLASTLIDMHTSDERRAVHLELAAALQDPDERALHLGRGTDEPNEGIASELEAASSRVDARGAPEMAASLAERAAALTPQAEAAAKTRRLLKAADLYSAAGEGQAHVYPLLGALAESLEPGPDRGRVFVRLGWLGAQIDSISGPEAIEYLERAITEADGDPDVSASSNAALARMRGLGGDYRAALRHAELAVESSASVEPNRMFPSPFGELGIARFYGGFGLDEDLFQRGIELESAAGGAGVAEPYQSPKLQLAKALLCVGELDRARVALLELLDLSVELERVRSTAGCVLQLADLEVRAGNLAQAEAYAAEFVSLDRQLRGDLGDEWYPSGAVAMHLGRTDDARRILQAGIAYSRAIGSTIWLAHHLWALGHLELAAGNLVDAKATLGQLPRLLRDTGLGEWSVHPFHPDLIETLVGLGEIDEAVELTAELEEYGRRLDRPWGLATAARSAALIASARGDVDGAYEAAERALAEHERLDWPLERGRSLLVAGGIVRRLGRRRDAAAMLAEARDVFELLRNPLWSTRAEAEQRRLGGRRAASDELTPTEARVAELAGQGLRNAEIAAQLYVTPKTVEATLSRVYRKLGIRSRTELAGQLAASRSAE